MKMVWFFLRGLSDSLMPDSDHMLVTALIIIVLTGFAGGLIARRLKQPLVLGYILAGVFVGIAYKASFGVAANDSLNSLADIGVALLLFSMGLEFAKKDIQPIFRIAVWGSLAQVLFTFFSAALLAWILNKSTHLFPNAASCLLFGVCFVSTSTAVLLKTLVSRKRMGTLSSKVMIGISIVQDLTVMPLLLIVTQLNKFSSGIASALEPLFLGAVFMTFMLTFGARWFPVFLKFTAKSNSKELFLLAVTGVALAVGALSNLMQVSFSFGAFLAGIVLSDSEYGKKALAEIMPVRDLFAMLFFVSIGMMLDIDFFLNNILLVLLLTILTGLARTIFLAAVTYFSGYRNVIPVAMLFGMLATSEIAFVVIQQGKNAGVFSEKTYSLILCVVVCSMLLGPLADALTAPVYAFLRRTVWKNGFFRDISLPPPDLSNHLIIAGGGSVGRAIAHLMEQRSLPYLLIESDYAAFQEARAQHLSVLYGDPQHPVILESAELSRARLVLAADGFQENLAVIKTIRSLNPKITVVTRADSEDEVRLLHEYKIYEIVQPQFEAALEMTRQSLLSLKVSPLEIQNFMDTVRLNRYKPLIEESPEALFSGQIRSLSGIIQLSWFLLPEKSALAGHSIAQSAVRSKTGVSIVGLLREHTAESNPPPDTVLRAGDTLGIIGTSEQISAFESLIGSERAPTPFAAANNPPVG